MKKYSITINGTTYIAEVEELDAGAETPVASPAAAPKAAPKGSAEGDARSGSRRKAGEGAHARAPSRR